MFLHNYAEWQRAIGIANVVTSGGGTSCPTSLTTMKGLAGSLNTPYLVGPNGSYSMFSYSGWYDIVNRVYVLENGLTFRVGTGTTAVDEGDYSLETDKTSSFADVEFNVNTGVSSDGHLTITVTWTGTNNDANAITITEIGLVKSFPMYHNNSISSSGLAGVQNRDVLIARYILSEPVTINPGDSGTLSARIEMF